MKFEWYPAKAESNLTKHGVSFDEASTVFDDDFQFSLRDTLHSIGEERFRCIGRSDQGRLLLVVYTQPQSNVMRLISARLATASERERYEQENYFA